MRDVLVLDYGGVLEIHDFIGFCSWLAERSTPGKDVISTYKKIRELRERDTIDEHDFFARLAEKLDFDIPKEEFYETYYTQFVHPCYETLAFIEQHLFGKYELYLFSNNSKITVRKLSERTHFERLFSRCVYSFDLRTSKPDIEFFRKGLELIGHKGEECLFFDDQLKSKENAEKLGIKLIQYKDLTQFKKDLAAEGIVF